jgi:hypothetical protein
MEGVKLINICNFMRQSFFILFLKNVTWAIDPTMKKRLTYGKHKNKNMGTEKKTLKKII